MLCFALLIAVVADGVVQDIGGWYDTMFYKTQSKLMKKQFASEGLLNLQRLGVPIVKVPQVPSTKPIPGPVPGTLLGAALDPSRSEVPAKFANSIKWQSLSSLSGSLSKPIPARFANSITTGAGLRTTVPQHLQGSIKAMDWASLPPHKKQRKTAATRSSSSRTAKG